MGNVKPLTIVGAGAALSLLTMLWWYSELAGRLGKVSFADSVSCLAKLGGGDCGALWLLGLHQENQTAGLIFYLGIGIAIVGLWLSAHKNSGNSDAQ